MTTTTLKIKKITADLHATATQKKQIKAGIMAGYEVFQTRDYVYEVKSKEGNILNILATEKRGSMEWSGKRSNPKSQKMQVHFAN